METIFQEKIRIGISACQFGSKVRYNAKGRDMLESIGRDKSSYIWTPVCPEIMSGMGVPRECIKLSKGNGFDFWNGEAIVKNSFGKDVSEFIKKGAIACIETLERAKIDAFVFMEGSPSCGIYRTSLKNKRLGNPPGVFGALLLEREIFLIPSTDLESPIRWWDWKRRLSIFTWLKRMEIGDKKTLKELWDKIKYVCHELDEEETKVIRHRIAEILSQDIFLEDRAKEVKKNILFLLRKPAELEMIKKWLWKNYIHMKEKEGISLNIIYSPDTPRNMTHIAQEMLGLEKSARENSKIFRSSPIDYRPKR